MSIGPTPKHYQLRTQLRERARMAMVDIRVTSLDMIALLDLLDAQDTELYSAWEQAMGEDL